MLYPRMHQACRLQLHLTTALLAQSGGFKEVQKISPSILGVISLCTRGCNGPVRPGVSGGCPLKCLGLEKTNFKHLFVKKTCKTVVNPSNYIIWYMYTCMYESMFCDSLKMPATMRTKTHQQVTRCAMHYVSWKRRGAGEWVKYSGPLRKHSNHFK